MADIRVLRPVAPDKDLIAILEGLLADAKSGRVVAIAGTVEMTNDEYEHFSGGTANWWCLSAKLMAYAVHELPYEDEDEE